MTKANENKQANKPQNTQEQDNKSTQEHAERERQLHSHSHNPCGRAGKDPSKVSEENPLGCNIKTEEEKHESKGENNKQ